MKKNIKIIIFLIIAILALYFTKSNYSDYTLEKSISACVIAQKQKSKNMSAKEMKEFCEKEINKNK